MQSDAATHARLILDAFLPYRLSVLNNRVSAALAGQYTERFGLTPAEWRVMAALGEGGRLSASEIVARTAMDKVQVSRAVSSLAESGRVARQADADDGRVVRLALSAAGRAIYDEIVPRALEFEAALTAALSAEERDLFGTLVMRLSKRAETLLDGVS